MKIQLANEIIGNFSFILKNVDKLKNKFYHMNP